MGNESLNGKHEGEEKISPEAWEIAEGLKVLTKEKNQLAIKVLCAGNGKEHGSFHMEGIGARLLGNAGDPLEDIVFQIEANNGANVYNFPSWENDLNGLAQELVTNGVNSKQLEEFIDQVEETAKRIEKKGSGWVITEYGPSNDGVISLEDFMNE